MPGKNGIFEKIKSFFKFSGVSSNFCENFDFRKTSWCLLGLKEMPWRTETFCKKSTELELSKKEVRSCLLILFAKLWHRWIWKKCAKMKKNMIFYSVFPRKKKRVWNVLKTFKNAQNDVSADSFFDKTHIWDFEFPNSFLSQNWKVPEVSLTVKVLVK